MPEPESHQQGHQTGQGEAHDAADEGDLAERPEGVGLKKESSERGPLEDRLHLGFLSDVSRRALWQCKGGGRELSVRLTSADLLKVDRVDHGVRSIEDPALVTRLADTRVALTVCPLSNLKLCVFDDLTKHTLKALLDKGVAVTVNSDDPAYFGGYVNANYLATIEALKLTDAEVYTIIRNSFEAAFVTPLERDALIAKLDAHWHAAGVN